MEGSLRRAGAPCPVWRHIGLYAYRLAALEAFEAEKVDKSFDAAGARFTLRLPAARVQALRIHLRDASRDRIRFEDA